MKNNKYFCINCGLSLKHSPYDKEFVECPNCKMITIMDIGDRWRAPKIKNKKNPQKEIKKFLKEIINPIWRKGLHERAPKEFNGLLDSYLGKYLPGKGKLAIISMSGGLDSATLCAEALYQGYDVFVINFNYNQKNSVEMQAFDNLIQIYQKNYISNGRIIGFKKINLKPLFDEFLDIWAELRDSGDIEDQANHQFYTPSRNLLFSVISAVIGEIIALSKGYDEIKIGLGIHKHSEEAYGEHRDYWDITPEFARRLEALFYINDVKRVGLFSPFVNNTKDEVVKRALELKVPINETWTCYNPSIKEGVAVPCLECEACKEREIAERKAGIQNPNSYHLILEESYINE